MKFLMKIFDLFYKGMIARFESGWIITDPILGINRDDDGDVIPDPKASTKASTDGFETS